MTHAKAEFEAGKVYVENVYVWTPSGMEVWSGNIGTRKAQRNGKVITRYSQPQEIRYAAQRGGFEPSSGLWYQTRSLLERERPNVEADFVTGEVERVSTVLIFLKPGERYADGLVAQYPFPDENGEDFLRDEKRIIRARQIWQMALPVKSSFVNQMPRELDLFLDTIYGMNGARNQIPEIPDFAYVSIMPGGDRSVLRSALGWDPRKVRRVGVCGYWAPARRLPGVGFRVFEGGKDSIKEC